MTTIEEGNVGSWASALSNLKGKRARQVALTPLSRAARPQECVGAYLFLACDQLSSFITGQSLKVNGGWVTP